MMILHSNSIEDLFIFSALSHPYFFYITFITTNYQSFMRVSPPLGFLTPRFLYFRRPAIANAVPSAPARVEQRGLRT